MSGSRRSGSPTVLITWPDYGMNHSELGERLIAAGLSIRVAPKTGSRDEEELAQLAAGCVAGIISTDPFTEAVLNRSAGLRILSRVGVGTDSIDVDAATRIGVVVTAARGTNEEAVADHTVALMLACLRRIVPFDAAVRGGSWVRTGAVTGSDLHHKTCGLVGFGAIGRAVAQRLAGFDVNILIHDPALEGTLPQEAVSLPELLGRSDIVSLHVPLLASTRMLIGRRQIADMKPGAVLVNTARGGIVDEAALTDALLSGHLRAAGIDVFEEEPPTGSPLLAAGDRVVLTPHVGGLTEESIFAMQRHATDAVLTYLGGGWPSGVVNESVRRARANR